MNNLKLEINLVEAALHKAEFDWQGAVDDLEGARSRVNAAKSLVLEKQKELIALLEQLNSAA